MSKRVPDGWVRTKLANVSHIQPGINVPKSKMGYGVPYVTVKDLYGATSINVHSLTLASIEDKNIKKHSLRYGDIVLAKSSVKREGIGFPIMFSGNEKHVIPSGFTVRVRPIPKIIDDNFLLQSQRSEITRQWVISNAQQSAITNLNADIINDIPVLLPPLPEQLKIASILTSVDEVIEKTQSQINKLQDLKKGTMNELFTRGMGHTEFKDSPVGRVPKGWEVKRLVDVATIQTGTAKNKNLTGDFVEVPYLRVANVQDGYLDLSEIKTISIERRKVDQFLLKTNDVLVNEGGDFDKLGRGYIWDGQISPCIHQNHVFVVRVNQNLVLPSYFNYLSGSQIGKKYYLGCAKQTTNLASINSSQLKMFPVVLPELEEQRRIVLMLSSMDTNIEEKQNKLQQTQSLKKSLMQDLLTGKVRVAVH